MKFILIILSFLTLNNGCAQENIDQDAISLEYSASSRGTFKNIKITKKNISYISARGNEPTITVCKKEDWSTLLKTLKDIDISNIPNLKAPSENRFFDGAAMANFKIIYQGKTYETPTFDHGNPPKEIAQLVKEMLSISENIE
ncbi:hypothetical protein [Mariniflexile sp.]|uniref:hypothetical protein n=1 Tax=Mariniflexile sp. TaxID=1979402 RepID=UPI003565DC32